MNSPYPKTVQQLREALGQPDDWQAKIDELYGWTGSAFLAGERVPEPDQHKASLYHFLCEIGGYLLAAQTAAQALSALETRSPIGEVGEMVARIGALYAKAVPESDSGWYVAGYTTDGRASIIDGLRHGIFPIRCEVPQANLIVALVNAWPTIADLITRLSLTREEGVERVARVIYEELANLFGEASETPWEELDSTSLEQGFVVARAVLAALSRPQPVERERELVEKLIAAIIDVISERDIHLAYDHFQHYAEFPCSASAMRSAFTMLLNGLDADAIPALPGEASDA